MKKALLIAISVCIMLFSFTFAAESYGIKVQLNGEYLDFTDEQGNKVEPQLINDRTMVPLRKIFESLDCKIDWNQATKTVTAKNESKEIVLTIDSETAKVRESGEEKEIKLDSVPVIVENRTLVPVRFIAESLEKEVSWEQATKTVIIIDYDKVLEEFKTKVPALENVFKMNLTEINSFKAKATVSGTIEYKDADDKTKNETVSISGTLDIIASKMDFQIDVKLKFVGKDGSIMSSIKEQGYENMDYRIVVKDGQTYIGKLNGKEYEWQTASDFGANMGLDTTNYVSIMSTMDGKKIDDYEGILYAIRQATGDTTSATYKAYIDSFDILGKMLSEENIKYTENGSKSTLSLNINFSNLLAKLLPDIEENILSSLDLKLSSKLNATKSVITDEVETIDFRFNAPDSKENLAISAKFDIKYSEVNKELSIEAPKI